MAPLLHQRTQQQIDAIQGNGSGSLIFYGQPALGKYMAAREVARRINCMGDTPDTCAACRQIAAGNYPDLVVIQPEDRPSIIIEQIRQLVGALALGLYRAAGTRIVIIDQAHTMTAEAQNALLKLLEEPPPSTLFILATSRLEALLPTVRSRCNLIHFSRPPMTETAAMLSRDHHVTPAQAERLVAAALGVPGEAVLLATNAEAAEIRLRLITDAASVTGQPLFDRLRLANRLIDAKTDLERFGEALHHWLITQIRSNSDHAVRSATQLQAVEQFRRHLAAKVAGRVALERLMLEL